jgi:aminoglycoside 2'-N-acetyltransferase I
VHHARVLTIDVRPTSAAPDALLEELHGLLEMAFHGGFDEHDWRHVLGGWHAIAFSDGVAVAHAAVVSRTLEIGGHGYRCGYVEGVATAPDRQGRGLGSAVMQALVTVLHETFEIGALSTSRPTFYERLGWERWQGPSYVRTAAGLVRTAEEDDGIMVLRFGPSRGIELTAPIACEQREGDDW